MRAQRCVGRAAAAAVAVLLVMAGAAEAAVMQDATSAATPPTATISGPAQAFRGEAVDLTATVTDDGTITAQAWDLDDDGAFDDATGPTASTTFDALGDKRVHFQVTDDEGLQTVADTVVAIVNRPPTVDITSAPSEGLRGQELTFAAMAADADPGAAPTLAWDTDNDGAFDDPATASYSTLGDKTVRVQATDADGATATDDAVVKIVNRPPIVEITDAPAQASRGQVLTFAATATDADPGAAPTLAWDTDDDGLFDDPATASYSTLGDKTVRVQATDADGATATDETVVTIINTGPTVQITDPPANAFRGQALTFTASSGDGDPGAPAPTLAWDTDEDGAFDDAATVSYSTLGAKTVRVQATDADGGTATDDAVVTIVNRAPTVDITGAPTESVRGQQLTFTAAGADADPGAAPPALTWDTDGDGQFDDATGGTATTSYSTLGAKPVRVRATDADGGSATDEAVVSIVNVPPTAAFTFSPAQPVAGQVVTFTSTSEDRDGTPLDERWDLDGDGAYDDAAGRQVSRSFPAGSNPVGLRVADGDGGSFTNRFTLRVLAPAGAAGAAPPAPSGGVAGTQAASDTTAPKLTFGVLRGQRLRRIAAKGIRLAVSLDEPSSVTVRLAVDKRTARRIGLDRTAKRPVVVAKLTRALAAGRTTVRPKLTAKARRGFARARRIPVRITVRAKDGAGNASSQTAKLTLRR